MMTRSEILPESDGSFLVPLKRLALIHRVHELDDQFCQRNQLT
jgi:hypothetical protein